MLFFFGTLIGIFITNFNTRIMKTILTSILVFLSLTQLIAQEELYFVSVPTTFMRSGPKSNFNVIAELNKGDQVQLMDDSYGDWWAVQVGVTNGFMKSSDLIAITGSVVVKEKVVEKIVEVSAGGSDSNQYEDWDETEYETGETPQCLNIVPEFDYKMDNHLKIKNEGSETEAVVKLIKIDNPDGDEVTYRIAFIKAGDNHDMKNVPAGKYYLKIAYGQEWKETSLGGRCTGKFTKNAQYEKGEDIVDFTPIRTSAGTELPSYELSLDVNHNGSNGLDTDDISEDEFND